MKLFNFKKKEEETSCGCGAEGCKPKAEPKSCCGSVDAHSVESANNKKCCGASVKVLGGGCKKCDQLTEATINALSSLNMDTTVDHVTDFSEIAVYGVMSTPALVVDGKVVSYGKVLSSDEVVTILKKVRSI